MRPHVGTLALAAACSLALAGSPARADFSPYVRFDYGSGQFKMTDGNALVQQWKDSFQSQGLPADFHHVPPGQGPSGSLGVWLLPDFRIGATYSHLRSMPSYRVHVPGQYFFEDDLDFRMTEIGGEAAVRFHRLHGLTFGGNVARGKAEMFEGYAEENVSSQTYEDASAHGRVTTVGGFIGLDQTNEKGVAGYMLVGYQRRWIGTLPSEVTMSDGVTTTQGTARTIPLDYSGVYFKVGVGFDIAH